MTSSDQRAAVKLCCPRCRGGLSRGPGEYECDACRASYPLIAGIADFRLWPDPYIGIEADRRKAEHLAEAGRTRGFAELLEYYYAITPEDPPDLARHWIAHALAEPEIAARLLEEGRVPVDGGVLLDLGCSTGGLLVAAAQAGGGESAVLTGVDVALRWLAVGAVRLREHGIGATLICANAEALPFADSTFSALTATDLLEHLRDAPRAISEARRVLRPGGFTMWTSNNRQAPVPEPHVRLWGVGWLPRARQARYVAWRRKDLHPYPITLRSFGEMGTLFGEAGFSEIEIGPAPAPVTAPRKAELLPRVYEALRRNPVTAALLARWGPKLWVRAHRR